MTACAWNPESARAYREDARSQPLRPYERVADRQVPTPAGYALARLTTDGWKFARFPAIPVIPPIDWAEAASSNRSWEFHLHCWDFLSPVLIQIDECPEDESIGYAVAVAMDWARTFPTPDNVGMAWYDMALGIRAQRLAYIVDVACRNDSISDQDIAALLNSVTSHQTALAEESIFNARSNHGLYVAAGQLAMARRLQRFPGMDACYVQAQERMALMIRSQFTAEGVHKEHSPDYHRMILDTLRSLEHAGLVVLEGTPTIEDIEDALAWFLMPDGSLTMFGDSPRSQLPFSEDYRSGHLRYVTSQGTSGTPPPTYWKAFQASGYAILRNGWPKPQDAFDDWSYLAFNASFHSRTHKHADDLSFVWYDRGQHILIDPGRFGYLEPTDPSSDLGKAGFYYSNPSRVYVEETRAHNAVEIDGASYQRRGVQPYGSGLIGAGDIGGVLYASGRVEHLTLSRNYRIKHSRLIIFRPRDWLIVFDQLEDPRNHQHQYRQWFQFAPEISVVVSDIGWQASLGSGDLWILPLNDLRHSRVFRGESEPQMQGWLSPVDGELIAASSVYTELIAKGRVKMATLFAFSETPPVPLHFEHHLDNLEFSWRGDAEHTVRISLSDGLPLEIQEVVSS